MENQIDSKIYISDERMLLLIDILKANSIIRFDSDFCDSIGLLRQTLTKIKKGEKHFTPDHIRNVILVYKADANWIFGIGDQIFLNKNYNKQHTKPNTKDKILTN
ncbi:hypothetical protein [Changchengzhania lutea]|uniref:hypothetical protein n=1 Tax=Changchengzhania lutea TaxID=2049305 RepID=UPI00115D1CF0|nr:hypothetical protein [Changchengzhania lutea]